MDYSERRQEQAQKTERTILRTALAFMRDRGFDKVSVRDICKGAGITTGAFYHHFPSKEAMFSKGFAPLDLYMEEALAGCATQDPKVRLWVILSTYGRFIEEECGELTAQYYQRRLADPHQVAPMDPNRSIHRAILACLNEAQSAAALPLGSSPEWAADFCYRHFRGVVIDWLLHGRSYSLVGRMEEDYRFFALPFSPKKD